MSITPELEINTRLIIGPCQLVSIVEPEKLKIHLCVPFSNNNVNRQKKNTTNVDFCLHAVVVIFCLCFNK